MPTLHVRSVPDDLYNHLQDLAQTRNRSLSAEVITLLYQALETVELRRQHGKALKSIRRRRFQPGKDVPDSLELLKEDRRR